MGKVQQHKRSAKAKRQVDFTTQSVEREDRYEVMGIVEECLPNTMFRMKISTSTVPQLVGRTILATLVGKMRLFRIRVLPGDEVKGYVTKYDLNKAKITFRSSQRSPQ